MRGGFTLIEVVVAVLVLQVGMLGALGMLVVAARTLTRAETLTWAVAEAEGVADSLVAASNPVAGGRPVRGGSLEWSVAGSGVTVRFVDEAGGGFEVHAERIGAGR